MPPRLEYWEAVRLGLAGPPMSRSYPRRTLRSRGMITSTPIDYSRINRRRNAAIIRQAVRRIARGRTRGYLGRRARVYYRRRY